MLTGQAKKDYQREYMRTYMRRRRATGLNATASSPVTVKTRTVKTQSYNPMMVGYVPPEPKA